MLMMLGLSMNITGDAYAKDASASSAASQVA